MVIIERLHKSQVRLYKVRSLRKIARILKQQSGQIFGAGTFIFS